MTGCEGSEDSSWRWWMRTSSPVHLTRPALETAAAAGPGEGRAYRVDGDRERIVWAEA